MQINNIYSFYINCNYKVYTDTRKPIDGAMFFALKGPGFNGNEFAELAISQGAKYVVVDEEINSNSPQIIRVENVLKTLQNLATYHRTKCNAKVIGIGGSNGKTTTKELLKRVLETKYAIHATLGNFNNHIGLPLTLLSMPIDTQIALLELGTNQKGDIEELCEICKPDFALITNVGKEHLEGFGDIESVAKEESQLYDFVYKNRGKAFVNRDDLWLSAMSKRFEEKEEYSFSDFVIHKLAPRIYLESKTKVKYNSSLAGIHNVSNIAAARAIGLYFGIEEINISKSILAYSPDNMRSEWRQTENNLLFLDAYNANPSSMEAAINTLVDVESDYKVAILGDMFELGSHSLTEHKNILEHARKAGFNILLTAGIEFSKVNNGKHSFELVEDLITFLKYEKIEGAIVLIKGSRGMKLEQVIPYL